MIRWAQGWYWELHGFYTAGRIYRGQGRIHALALTLWCGWRD